jgi:hypothetical protein
MAYWVYIKFAWDGNWGRVYLSDAAMMHEWLDAINKDFTALVIRKE